MARIFGTEPNRTQKTCLGSFRFSSQCAALGVAALLSFPLYAAGDFAKIANNGTVLAADAKLGNGAADWACTRDNATGLMWEVKAADGGLRDHKHTYAWFNTDPEINGGSAGFYGTDTCSGTLSAYRNQCNTTNYVAAVNAVALCGDTDWRMPNAEELYSLVDFSPSGDRVAIDPDYFPNMPGPFFWSVSAVVGLYLDTWIVNTGDGKGCGSMKGGAFGVQLVRGGKNKSK